MMREVDPRDRCSKCGHESREHATDLLGAMCMVGRQRNRVRPYPCPCARFEAEPRTA